MSTQQLNPARRLHPVVTFHATIYDLETFPNFFSCAAEDWGTDAAAYWEISSRRNDSASFLAWLRYLAMNDIYMIGYNNIAFDYRIVHKVMENPEYWLHPERLAQLAHDLIHTDEYPMIWESDRFIKQIDLMKLNHYDREQRYASLKHLEYTMRSESIEELPVKPGSLLTIEEMERTEVYNKYDTAQTKKFAKISWPKIELRLELIQSRALKGDVMNWSDTKIGSQTVIQQLPYDLIYYKDCEGKRQVRQTPRDYIEAKNIIFPYIKFQTPLFNEVLDDYKNLTIYNTKGGYKKELHIHGVKFAYGIGGVHASVERKTYKSTDACIIIDVDVTSLYPNIAVKNKMFPEHLGVGFIPKYASILSERSKHAKGTSKNASLKLAANSVYGESNASFSALHDPQYTVQTTINGQLLISMLVEWLILSIPGLELIQVNTDGVTVYIDRNHMDAFHRICDVWQNYTLLNLERVEYESMWIRDVNNYIARKPDGSLKQIGAYQTDWTKDGWHKDWSNMASTRAAIEHMTNGIPIETALHRNSDPYDFCLLCKPKGRVKVTHDELEVGKITRHFVCNPALGAPLRVTRPPVAGFQAGWFKKRSGVTDAEYFQHDPNVHNPAVHTKNMSRYDSRTSVVNGGRNVIICNHMRDFNFLALNYSFYILEAEKLVV